MAFNKGAKDAANFAPSIRSALPGYDKLSPLDQVQQLIVSFSDKFQVNIEQSSASLESKLVGELSGYINVVDPNISIASDTTINVGRYHFVADLLLNNRGDKIVVEIKRPGSGLAIIRSGEEQLFSYLTGSDIDAGILFVPPAERGTSMTTEVITRSSSGVQKQVVKIYPANMSRESGVQHQETSPK